MFAAFGGLRVYSHMASSGISALLMENVEALTFTEGGGNPTTDTCYSYGYDTLFTSNQYACEGQRPEDPPKACVPRGFFRGHDDYKRKCLK